MVTGLLYRLRALLRRRAVERELERNCGFTSSPLVGLFASLLPARRAAALEPLVALRHE